MCCRWQGGIPGILRAVISDFSKLVAHARTFWAAATHQVFACGEDRRPIEQVGKTELEYFPYGVTIPRK